MTKYMNISHLFNCSELRLQASQAEDLFYNNNNNCNISQRINQINIFTE